MRASGIKSLLWVDFFLYSVTDPGKLYRQIQKNDPRPYALSFSVPIIVSLIEILAGSCMSAQTPYFYYRVTYGWIMSVIITLFSVIVAGTLMDMMAQLMGYSGRIKDIICLLNYSLFPGALILPVVYIFKVINFAPLFFYVLVSIMLFLWSAFIAIKGISEMHSSGFARSFIIYFFPFVLLGTVVFLVSILGIISIAGLLLG